MSQASRERIVVLDDWNDFWGDKPGVARLRERAEVVIHTRPAADEAEVIARLRGATIAIANRERTPLHAGVLSAAPDLRLIAQTGRISPNVDAEAATTRGIALLAAGGGTGGSAGVAELGMALLLGLARQIPRNDRRVREGDWAAPTTELLHGRTLGIVGLGNIGRAMARLGAAFDMPIIAWGPTLTPERAAASGAEYVAFDDLFGRADVVFVSVRLSDLTRGLIGERQLAAMKPTAYLVNIARGPIVDEAALVRALERRQIAGAGLDVFDREPLPKDHPLTRLDNVVLTPHVGWGTTDNFALFVENLCAAVLRYLDGDARDVANREALQARPASAG
jgi:D-3-phosphoglycerate dehydrogenase / 2-oxoglutarate reductase